MNNNQSQNFSKIDLKDNLIIINKKRKFNPLGKISNKGIIDASEFAKKMTYEKEGEHRKSRSGGIHVRDNDEIFSNTFRGKLAEIAFYEFFKNKNGIVISEPDFETYKRGKWDNTDFILNNFKINVKSSTHFSNLLLLEKKDWNSNAEYIPNIPFKEQNYDFFFFIRIHSDDKTYPFDIPGYVTNADLKLIIQNNHSILKGYTLGSKKLDADNYYFQSGEMRQLRINKLV